MLAVIGINGKHSGKEMDDICLMILRMRRKWMIFDVMIFFDLFDLWLYRILPG